ncbi:MAG TPA: glycosyltransferase, partial [Bacteroidales bacterium]|nr:glycosyltransferase [Bacteroidales bacterium]
MSHRIAYLVSTLRRTGPTHQLLYLIRHLDPMAFEPMVITLSPEPDDSMMELFLDEGIPVYSLRLGRLKGMLLAGTRLRSMLKDLSPAVMHTQGLRPDLLGAALQGMPVVSTQRNDPFVDYPAKYGPWKGGLMAWQQMRAVHQSRHAYACASSLAEAFARKYKIDMPFVRNGVDTDHWAPADALARARARELLGLPADAFVVLAVGSLIPRKDPISLLAALQAGDNSRILVLAGKGPEAERLRRMEPDTSRLLMPGQVDHVIDYLHAADVFISASLGEGLPNTVLEAMAAGLPVVLSDIPSHREVMQGLEWPFFFRPGSGGEGLNEALKRLEEEKDIWSGWMRAQAMKFSARTMSA